MSCLMRHERSEVDHLKTVENLGYPLLEESMLNLATLAANCLLKDDFDLYCGRAAEHDFLCMGEQLWAQAVGHA